VKEPALIDLAPTVLDLFGVPIPGYMQGRPLFAGTVAAGDRTKRPAAVEVNA